MNVIQKLRTFFLALFPITLVIVTIILPYGLNVNGVLEEYLYMNVSIFPEQASDLLNSGQLILRPLAFPIGIAGTYITPYSYFGMNILNFTFIIMKGLVLFYILRRLNIQKSNALAIAILYTIYPINAVDLRLVILQATILAFLWAVLFFLRLNATWRNRDLLLMMLFLGVTTLIYEATYVLILFVPLIPILFERKITKRIIILAISWYIVPTLVALRWLYYFFTIDESYQRNNIVGIDNSPATLFTEVLDTYWRTLVNLWYEAMISVYNADVFYFLLVAIVATILMLLFSKIRPNDIVNPGRQLFIQMLGGLAVIIFGYAVFAITSVREHHERIFSLSTIGSAIFVVCFVSWITAYAGKYRHILWSAVIVSLISLSLFSVLVSRENSLSLAFEQQSISAGIVERVPASDASAVIIFSSGNAILERSVEIPLRIVYADIELLVAVCYPRYYWYQESVCQFETDEILIEKTTNTGIESRRFTYEEIIAFYYQGNGELELLEVISETFVDGNAITNYAPFDLICQECSYPALTNRYFTSFPFESPIREGLTLGKILSNLR